MHMNPLGNSNILVSKICLGTMTWGTQNDQQEANQQIDYAIEQGVNFLDTAEMYPTTPLSDKTAGDTERIIGNWIKKTGRRDEIILATKVCGRGYSGIRNGAPITKKTIRTALEGSLKRLKTDYVDLYQLHWPNRGSYHFRQAWTYDPSDQNTEEVIDNINEVLLELDAQIQKGTIRTVGLSNESAWGTMQFLNIAKEQNLPRMVSIQNEYSLIDRKYDLDMAELSHHERIGCLAWSPLAAGLLTGKYLNGAVPDGSRKSITPDMRNRTAKVIEDAVAHYCDIAKKHGVNPAQMAIAFCCDRPFMTSTIIGATTMEQLETNIAAKDLVLSEELKNDITEAFKRFPAPQG